MASELRIVVDTGVAISGALMPGSVPRRALDAAMSHGRLLVSETTTLELDDVFRRPKFNKYVSEERRLEFLAALVRDAELVNITEEVRACRDSQDDKFLEVAVNGKASHIISGDGDLLALHPFRGIEIVTPQVFLSMLQKNGPATP